MRGKPPRLLIFLQALFLSTVTSQAAQSKGSVHPLIERLSVQKLEPLGWLKSSNAEVRDKPLSPVPVSSPIPIVQTHKRDSKHRAYASTQGLKSLRFNERAAPFTKKQNNQLKAEQGNSTPSQEQNSIPQLQPLEKIDSEVQEPSPDAGAASKLDQYLYRIRGSKYPKIKDDVISTNKSSSSRDADALPQQKGVIETHDHIVVLGKSISSNASSNSTSSKGYSCQSESEVNQDGENTSNISVENISSARRSSSSRQKPHRVTNQTISKTEPSVPSRGIAGRINGTIPVFIPENPVLPAPPKITSGPARYQGGGARIRPPWMCDKAYNPTLAGCVDFV